MLKNRLRYGLAASLLAGALFILLSFIYHVVNPPSASRSWTYGDTQIHFSADRGAVLFPWQCVTVRWEVSQFRTITINGASQGGSGEAVACPDYLHTRILNIHHFTPTLSVKLADGQHEDFALSIEVIPFNIVSWLEIALVIVLILLAGGGAEMPWISRLSRHTADILSVRQDLTPAQASLTHWMGYVFAGLNIIFIVFTLSAIGKMTFWLAAPLIALAMPLAAASLNSRVLVPR